MAREHRAARKSGLRTNLYDDITDKIIAELEDGRLPWVQPWGTAAAQAPLAMPRNASTGRQYSGINVLILWGAVIQQGYPTQHWLTFRQALSLGGNVRKGERGTTVVYADRFTPDDEKRRARETGEDANSIPFLKRFTVFNAAQCEGLPDDIAVEAPPPPPGLIEPRVEALIAATGIDFRIGGNRAFYVPALDYVHRTLALRNAVAANSHVAMTALLHRLVTDCFLPHSTRGCLEAHVREVHFPAQADDLGESTSARAIADRHERWGDLIPADDAALWDWLVDQDDDTRMELLAHCISFGVNALHEKPNPYGGMGFASTGSTCACPRPTGWRGQPGCAIKALARGSDCQTGAPVGLSSP